MCGEKYEAVFSDIYKVISKLGGTSPWIKKTYINKNNQLDSLAVLLQELIEKYAD